MGLLQEGPQGGLCAESLGLLQEKGEDLRADRNLLWPIPNR